MSWQSFLFIKFISLFNYVSEIFNNKHNNCKRIFYYLKSYYNGNHDIWLFVPGHTFPLSLHNLNNRINTNWIYDNYNNTLTFTENKEHIYKLSWLSAKIVDSNKEYEMDDFIEKLSIFSNSNVTPSLYIICICWCIYTKHWFTMDNIEIHIIDDNGEEVVLHLHNSVIIKNNKLYIENTFENKQLREEHKNKDE